MNEWINVRLINISQFIQFNSIQHHNIDILLFGSSSSSSVWLNTIKLDAHPYNPMQFVCLFFYLQNLLLSFIYSFFPHFVIMGIFFLFWLKNNNQNFSRLLYAKKRQRLIILAHWVSIEEKKIQGVKNKKQQQNIL